MNKSSFLSLVRQASNISDQEVEELEKLVVNFPYCQTAHLLIAKAAYDKGSMLSNQKLKKAAIYAANRQLLKKLIYTSDASVVLQPVVETDTFVASAATQVTTAEQDVLVSKGNIAEAKDFVEAVVESETLSEPAEKVLLVETEIPAPESVISPDQISEPQTESQPQTETNEALENEADIIFQTDHEDAAIAEEILEEGYLPESEAAFLGFSEINEPTLPEFKETVTSEISEDIAVEEPVQLISESEFETISEAEIQQETQSEIAVTETVVETAEKVEETEVQIPEEAILAEEIEIAEAFDNIESVNFVSEIPETEISETKTAEIERSEILNQEITAETSTPEILSEEEKEFEIQEATETYPARVLNDELLHETLESFDKYLFRPEKDTEEIEPETDLKVIYAQDEIQTIYDSDPLGYWMGSSRLGEALQLKDELTANKPLAFHPELILEYSKTHELHKEIKPVNSNLSRQLEIIDEFLKMTPRLKAMANAKVKTEVQEDLSTRSSKISKNLATESLANIMVQQGKIKKAIKIYEHLILKIPEKKPYFVAQIEKLRNLE